MSDELKRARAKAVLDMSYHTIHASHPFWGAAEDCPELGAEVVAAAVRDIAKALMGEDTVDGVVRWITSPAGAEPPKHEFGDEFYEVLEMAEDAHAAGVTAEAFAAAVRTLFDLPQK